MPRRGRRPRIRARRPRSGPRLALLRSLHHQGWRSRLLLRRPKPRSSTSSPTCTTCAWATAKSPLPTCSWSGSLLPAGRLARSTRHCTTKRASRSSCWVLRRSEAPRPRSCRSRCYRRCGARRVLGLGPLSSEAGAARRPPLGCSHRPSLTPPPPKKKTGGVVGCAAAPQCGQLHGLLRRAARAGV
jgi:hypothetical protein